MLARGRRRRPVERADRHVRVRAAGRGPDVSRRGASDPARGETRRSSAYLIVAKPKAELRETWVTLLSRLAVAFLVGLVVVGALAWYLSRRITEPVLALSRGGRPGRAGTATTSRCPTCRAAARSATSPSGSGEMAARLAETEELERNFLMSVSHELRTPLTAIRGHVAALREGVVTDPELREESLDDRRRRGGAARAPRRRRPRPREARRAPVHRADRGGRHEPARRPRLLDLRRGGPAARDRLHAGAPKGRR